ncbi:MAG: hypothetical protein HQK99_06535 [Nitrospirae bacterium]|nr:hypothetical protein [Nitrospirota bacterium]
MATTLPVEMYDLLERKIGKEEAREFGKVLTASIDAIEIRAEALIVQKKAEIKEELTNELATKEDLARLEGRLSAKIASVESGLSAKIASVESGLSAKIASVESGLNERITSLEGRLNERITSLEGRLNERITSLEGGLNERITSLEGRLSEKIAAVNERITAVEGRLSEKLTAIDWKMKIYFLILLFVILLTNPKALDLIARIFGLVK